MYYVTDDEHGLDLSKIPNPTGLPYRIWFWDSTEIWTDKGEGKSVQTVAVTDEALYLLDYRLRDDAKKEFEIQVGAFETGEDEFEEV